MSFITSLIQSGVYYPPVGFYFRLGFSAIFDDNDVGFQEASGISVELPTEDYYEGGENRFNWKLPSAPKYSNLVLKRGLMTRESSVKGWCEDTIQGEFLMNSLFSSAINTKQIYLSLLNANGDISMRWTFYKAYPVKWEVSDFNSEKNEVLVETIEFAFGYFDTLKLDLLNDMLG